MVRKETLEYGRFTRTRRARYNDWAVFSGRYQVKSSNPMDFAYQNSTYLREPLPSNETNKKEFYRVETLDVVMWGELMQLPTKAFAWISSKVR